MLPTNALPLDSASRLPSSTLPDFTCQLLNNYNAALRIVQVGHTWFNSYWYWARKTSTSPLGQFLT